MASATSKQSRLTKVISVCSLKDLKTWQIASRHILKNIQSDKYILIAPDEDLPIFRSVTPNSFDVIGESAYAENMRDILKNRMPVNTHGRLGWYLQQFIKLAALKATHENDLTLIWDADTIPLKPLNFSDSEGKLRFYKGTEHHSPYFQLILKLLGMKKIVNFSFIAQCFPIKGGWANEFFNYIEERHNKTWIDAMLDEINFSESSGFSEYETLGTYISHAHKDEVVFIDSNWLRWGNSALGSINNLNDFRSKFLLRKYDFVAFETWDAPLRKKTFEYL